MICFFNIQSVLAISTVVTMALSAHGLTIPIKDLPENLDPQMTKSIYDMIVNLQLHRGLMRFLPNLSIAPDLAESFEVLDDGKRIRFHLAKRSFSDGERVTAQHVVRTFQRLFVIRAGFAADMDYIVNARVLMTDSTMRPNPDILGVHAIDANTVEFKLVRPVSIFLAHLAAVDAAILPLKEDLKYDWHKQSGAGPYRVKSSDKTAIQLELVATPDKPKTKSPPQIKFETLGTDEAIKASLQGKVDSLDGYSIPQASVENLKNKGWQESVSTITRQLFLVQNPNRISKKVRDAIFTAVMTAKEPLLPAPYIKSYGLIPNSLAGSLSDPQVMPTKISPLEKREKVSVMIVEGEPSLATLAKNLTDLLTPLNIEIKVIQISLKDYMPTIEKKEYDILIRSKFLDYPDGLSILTYFRSSYSANTFFVESPEVDTLIESALLELDKNKRTKLYEVIQEKILAQRTVVPIVFGSDNRGLWSDKIKSVPAHPLGLQGLPLETIETR